MQRLLLTTALVLCVSTGFAGQNTHETSDRISVLNRKFGLPVGPHHRILAAMPVGKAGAPGHLNVLPDVANATFNNFSKDANARFVSWYGYVTEGVFSGDCSCTCSAFTASNAIPFTGAGATVTRIKVPITSLTGPNTEFNVGIYSATASGLPGSLELAGGSTTASDTKYCCTAVRSVSVNITLKAGKKYFLEVSCAYVEDCSGGWDMEDTDLSGTAQDYFRYKLVQYSYCGGGTHISSSPWHLSTEYPEQPAAVIK